jgi:hypothetical protein
VSKAFATIGIWGGLGYALAHRSLDGWPFFALIAAVVVCTGMVWIEIPPSGTAARPGMGTVGRDVH